MAETYESTVERQPVPMPQMKRPTRYPTPRPSRYPTGRPTAKVMSSASSPTFFYEVFLTRPTMDGAVRPRPTRKPTKKPRRTPMPTRRNSSSEQNSLTSSFLGMPTSTFTMNSKGSETHVGDSIKNQIQLQKKKQTKGNKQG